MQVRSEPILRCSIRHLPNKHCGRIEISFDQSAIACVSRDARSNEMSLSEVQRNVQLMKRKKIFALNPQSGVKIAIICHRGCQNCKNVMSPYRWVIRPQLTKC